MNLIRKKMHLITYGLGNAFDPRKFKPVTNRDFVKPNGGLWASPVRSKYGWKHWCKAESFGKLDTSFTYWYQGNVLVINSRLDAMEMPWYAPYDLPSLMYPDYEALAKMGVDAIHLTINGQHETRLTVDYSMYGWDCESVLIINPDGIILDTKGD